MKLHSKISLTIFILILAGLIAWLFFLAKDRYSNNDPNSNESEVIDESAEFEDEIGDDSVSPEENFDEEENEEEVALDEEEDTFLEILPSDCKNECKNYQETEDIDYCKQICGLTIPKKELTGCDALVDLEKDYCLKDEAISKADPKICDKIEDSGIKKTCKNRLIEDILDQQRL
ncbi:MAG: hypothetical protein ACD_9C00281G0001 [uncultured bacterium]|nr:MAG: hypothetical protein ACD_9C00281G0001 [uncultured bacterium]